MKVVVCIKQVPDTKGGVKFKLQLSFYYLLFVIIWLTLKELLK